MIYIVTYLSIAAFIGLIYGLTTSELDKKAFGVLGLTLRGAVVGVCWPVFLFISLEWGDEL